MNIKLNSIKTFGKKILSAFILSSLLFEMNAYALDQVLTTPNPSYVENKLQTGVNFAMNSMMLWFNADYQNYTSIIQHLKFNRSKIGWIIFKLQRTAELADWAEPEKIRVELKQFGNIIATELLDGASSATSPESIKWMFPDGLEITPNVDLQFVIKLENDTFQNIPADQPTTINTFPYYTIGTSYVNGAKPDWFSNLEYFDGANTVMTDTLLNLTVVKKELNDLSVTLPSKYRYPQLTSQELAFLNNASDIKILTNVDTTNITSQCSSLTTGSNPNIYRPMTSAEAEILLKNSDLFYGVGWVLDSTKNPSLAWVFSTNGAEFVTPTKVFKFSGVNYNVVGWNIMQNGNFEQQAVGNTTSGWLWGSQAASHWMYAGTTEVGWYGSIQSSVVKGGTLALRLTIGQGGYKEFRNDANSWYFGTVQPTIKPNTRYRLSGWVKSANVSWTSSHGWMITFLTADSSWNSAGSTNVGNYFGNGINQDWTYVESEFVTAANAAYGHIEARVYGHTTPWTLKWDFYFDDIKVEELAPSITSGADLLNTIKNQKKYYSSTSTTNTLPTTNWFGLCVFDQSQNISWIDQKDLKLNNKDDIQLNALNLNTEGFLNNKTQPTKVAKLNVKNAIDLDTNINVQPWDSVKVYGKVKLGVSGYNTANGYYDTDTLKWNIKYKVWENGVIMNGSEYQIVTSSGKLYVSVDDVDGLTNNDGEFTIAVEPVLFTNSIRENNNLYVQARRNVNDIKVNIKESADNGLTYGDHYAASTTTKYKVNEIYVDGMKFSSEKEINGSFTNADAIAVDGTYVYTLKGNKLNITGTNLNGTDEWLSSTYTLDKDLTGVKSLVSYKGVLYAGYSEVWMCDRIAKITLNTSLNATVEMIKISTCLLDYDLGDIDGKKVSKTNYSLSSDGEFVYSLSYLAGTQSNGNNDTKDLGYRVRVFDPNNGFSLVKDTLVPTIRKVDNATAVVNTKVGYYTEWFVVDENYIYVIQKPTTGNSAKVIVINKNKFTYKNSFSLDQDFTTCQNVSTANNTYSCPKAGGWNYLSDEFVFLSTNSTKTKLSYYKANKDNLINILLPSDIPFQKNQKYSFSYNYKYSEFLRTGIGISSYNNKETINNGSLVVSKWYKIGNNVVESVIGDKVTYTNGTSFNEWNGGVYNLVRKNGNSSTIRKNSVGFNNYRFEMWLYGKAKSNVKFGSDYGTVTTVNNDSYNIAGDRDDNTIVPSISYYYKASNVSALSVDVSFRNDSTQDKTYSSNMYFGLNNIDTVKYSNGTPANNSTAETSYLDIATSNTDDNLAFFITNGSQAKLYYDTVSNSVRVGMDNFNIPAWKTVTYTFHVGSYLKTETAQSVHDKLTNPTLQEWAKNILWTGEKRMPN